MDAPAPLTEGDCPLLLRHGGAAARDLLARYAESLAKLDAASADPELSALAGERLDAVAAPLRRARDKLARRRYAVGFIGLTQAGKSTTVNRLLGEEVCKSGVGDATSSQPARLVRGPRPMVEVEYLTPARFAARRADLCAAVGLSAPPEDDDRLAALLDEKGAFDQVRAERPRLDDDRAYLRDFLAARRRHGADALREPAHAERGIPFEKRFEYTAHRPGKDAGRDLLVREARLHLDNANLPEELELCDLPGLDSKRTVDDLVTRDYLPELDGTFLFVNAGMALETAGMRGTLDLVARQFGGRTGSRAWVIFTKMDALGENAFGPERSVFAVIANVLGGIGIPPAQVCFCSNQIASRVSKLPEADRRAEAARMLSQTPESPVPAATPPEFRAAWEAMLLDGGIGRIRRLMTEEVGQALAAQIRADAGELLAKFDDDLARAAEAERARLDGGGQLLDWAMTCRAEVMDLARTLARRPDQFPAIHAEAEALSKELGQFLTSEATVRVVSELAGAGLADEFRMRARQLGGALVRRMTQTPQAGIEAIYDAVGASLSTLPAPPGVRGGKVRSCGEAWDGYRKADRAGDWLDRSAFASPDLEDLLRKSDGLGGAEYLDLMGEKVGAAVRQTLHQVRARLRQRLGELQSDLTLLTAEPAPE